MAAASSVSSRLSSNASEIFVYSHEEVVSGLTEFIITMGFPLNFGENLSFVEFTQEQLNPNFREVKKETVIAEAKKQYKNLKEELLSIFASLTHKIALACDVWRHANGLQFIRLTAHWVDSDWLMQRRIIDLKMIDFPIHDDDISDKIKNSVDSWGISEKILSFTLDNVSNRAEVREDLKNLLNPILDGKVFNIRCVCRILNSCVQAGWKFVGSIITRIRNGISLIQYPEVFPHYEGFGNFCKKYDLKPKMILFDEEKRWDSTYEMLKSCLPYKDALTDFIAKNWPRDESLLSEQEWDIISVFCRFLDVFREAVCYVSGNYSPSSCGVLLHLVNIAKLFSEFRGSVIAKEIISVMEEKFFKNFDRIPELYCLGAVMDPRIKLSGCECLLESFYQFNDNVKVTVEEEKTETSNLLYEMYDIYKSQSGNQHHSSSGATMSFGFAWSIISKKKGKEAFNELTFYLQSSHDCDEDKDFDILGWWKKHEIIYPVLSIMARDLLTIPVSTLAPDCAFVFNTRRRILNETEYVMSLKDERLEVYTCLRDWFHAERRTQGEIGEESDDEEQSCYEFAEELRSKVKKSRKSKSKQ